MWSSGDAVVLREVWKGRVWRAIAGRVIEDTDRRTVLWCPRGAPSMYAARPDGTEIRIPCDDWALAHRTASLDAVVERGPDARHSMWTLRSQDGSLAHWYVNFDRALQRIPAGFEFVDEKLDLVVEPDGTRRWKDEDELVEAARLGLLDADEVWAEARRVTSNPPWPTGWEDWRPDPGWELPRLPETWDVV
jgi:predicted RNA-binding protein associated with RNAse of E/G family